MKKILLLVASASISQWAAAQYQPVEKESSVTFMVRNFGIQVSGLFTTIKGSIHFDTQNPSNDLFDIKIDAATVNTDNNMRDEHLKGSYYLDTANYAAIHFVSTSVTRDKSGPFNMTGNLEIKGKTRVITFPFTAVQVNERLQFKGNFKINRQDFGVGGTSTISNEVEVFLNVIAQKSSTI
jgi:polyisoprenoid-binding protein YceI